MIRRDDSTMAGNSTAVCSGGITIAAILALIAIRILMERK